MLRSNRYTLELIRKENRYTMSFFDREYQDEIVKFGMSSGRDSNKKMTNTTLTAVETPSGNMSYKEAKIIIELDLFEVFGDIPLFRLDVNQQAWVESIFDKMLQERNANQPGSYAYARLLLVELLIFIARLNRQRERASEGFPNARHRQISEIVRFINTHYQERLTLDQLSRKFHLSPSHLSRMFKEVTGFGVNEFVNHVRIKEAQRLLRTTRCRITEIAERTGYDNVTHFGRVFKKMTGFSPSRYRKTSAEASEWKG